MRRDARATSSSSARAPRQITAVQRLLRWCRCVDNLHGPIPEGDQARLEEQLAELVRMGDDASVEALADGAGLERSPA